MITRILLITAALATLCFVGCKQKEEPEADIEIKTTEEYKDEAAEEITEENAQEKLTNIEQQLESEIKDETQSQD